ncbi:hypothetical protein Droror1_Dr00020451 [Drosera rotundifolia]
MWQGNGMGNGMIGGCGRQNGEGKTMMVGSDKDAGRQPVDGEQPSSPFPLPNPIATPNPFFFPTPFASPRRLPLPYLHPSCHLPSLLTLPFPFPSSTSQISLSLTSSDSTAPTHPAASRLRATSRPLSSEVTQPSFRFPLCLWYHCDVGLGCLIRGVRVVLVWNLKSLIVSRAKDGVASGYTGTYLGSKRCSGTIITFEYVIVTVSSSCRTCFVACEYHA